MENLPIKLPDYYKILNLPFGSTSEEIKKNFRELAKAFHPDNLRTGCRERFLEVHNAYSTLSGMNREKYDEIYKLVFREDKNSILLPPNRIVYASRLIDLAKRGLLKSGLRRRDRRKFTGIYHDLELLIKQDESGKRIRVKLPLVVRVLCPDCGGSNIFCDVCGGIGTYKSTRILQVSFEPNLLKQGRLFELELSRFRPDKFIHFKKKLLKIRVNIIG